MKVRKSWLISLALGAAFLLAQTGSFAQSAATEPPADAPPGPAEMQGPPPPPDGGFGMVGFEGELQSQPVIGAPYSAHISVDHTQTLADGNHIEHKASGMVYRDSQGRTRREMTLPAIGPLAAASGSRQVVFINDPVAGVQYVLHPDKKTAEKLPRRGNGGDTVRSRIRHRLESATANTETLGTETIAGLQAQGTRTSETIPAGQIGNEKPIEIQSERWNSPDLHVDVMTKRSDPRMGTSVFQLSDITRTEPAAALFEVPSDYTVKDAPPWRHHGPEPPPQP